MAVPTERERAALPARTAAPRAKPSAAQWTRRPVIAEVSATEAGVPPTINVLALPLV
jgi:hypothetical protein